MKIHFIKILLLPSTSTTANFGANMLAKMAAPKARYKRFMFKRYPNASLAVRNKIANPKKFSKIAFNLRFMA